MGFLKVLFNYKDRIQLRLCGSSVNRVGTPLQLRRCAKHIFYFAQRRKESRGAVKQGRNRGIYEKYRSTEKPGFLPGLLFLPRHPSSYSSQSQQLFQERYLQSVHY